MKKYNLLDEPFIPVIRVGGKQDVVSLQQLILEADTIFDVVPESVTGGLALFMLVLGIVYRVTKGGPKGKTEWAKMWKRGNFRTKAMTSYLKKWHDRFYLLHDKVPFLQHIFPAKYKSTLVAKVMPTIPTGTNMLIDNLVTGESMDSIPLDRCAIELLRNQFCGVNCGKAGGGKNTENAPVVQGIAAALTGRSFFQLVMLNLLTHSAQRQAVLPDGTDWTPPWERPEEAFVFDKKECCPRMVSGVLDLLTMLNRRIQFLPDEDGNVKYMNFTQGESCMAFVFSPSKRSKFPKDALAQIPRLHPMHFGYDKAALKAKREAAKVEAKRQRKAQKSGMTLKPKPVKLPKSEVVPVKMWMDTEAWREYKSLFAFKGLKVADRFCPAAMSQAQQFYEDGLITDDTLGVTLWGVMMDKAEYRCGRETTMAFSTAMMDKKSGCYLVMSDALQTVDHSFRQCFGAISAMAESRVKEIGGSSHSETMKRILQELKDQTQGITFAFWSKLRNEFDVFFHTMLDDPKGALDRWKQVVREESLVLVDDSAEQLNADWRARVMAYDIVDPCPETTSTARKEVRI